MSKYEYFFPEDDEYVHDTFIICPYCGEKKEMDCEEFEFFQGSETYKCRDCEKEFDVTSEIEWKIRSSKKED